MSTSAPHKNSPPVVGLTGGIAGGKSSVSREFARLGAAIVDADLLAREVVAPGSPALAEVRQHFGQDFILPDGSLDRKRLGSLVFADAGARAALNAITHPRIAARGRELIETLGKKGHRPVLYEAPLLVENGLHTWMDGLIVVSLPEPEQLVRLMARDGLGVDEARARIAAQKPLAEKIAVADYVIDNSGTLEDTRRQVEEVWQKLQARF